MTEQSTDEYDFKSVENGWITQWDKDQLYIAKRDTTKTKFYCLDTWPYPSAEGVHVGYVKSFGGMDLVARYKRMQGLDILHPIGWDTLGLPAENYAIKSNRHPREITDESIINFRKQFKSFGLSFDWSREINTADPSYYKWTQWIFLVMFNNGLAYRQKSAVNWCPKDKTVLANEQVIGGKCERCGTEVVQKKLMQWFFKVTEYADRLYEDCKKLNWEQKYLNVHQKWIGKKVKTERITFNIRDWCVSRQRYWGPPIPIVYCDSCGTVAVPEKDLPIELPYNVDFTPTGEAPLAKNPDFVNTFCPKCGGKARREVDVLDTFVSSAWYEFRFPDPNNDRELVSSEALKAWGTVDQYEGTIEHLTAHLIYARFVTKVLFDKGYLPFDEPFPKYTPVGLLVDKAGAKFSKRLGNAPDTNELIEKYGGDLLRLSCQFINPYDDITRWGEQDTVGVRKFRDKIWRVFQENVDGKDHNMPEKIIQQTNQLIKDVEKNIELMRFNVALSKMMVFINELVDYDGKVDKTVWETFTKIFAPFAPFITEEMWHQMGHTTSVHTESWPSFDEKQRSNKQVKISVQINGKVKGIIEVPAGSTQSHVESIINKNPKLCNYITNNVIFIVDKVINFIT